MECPDITVIIPVYNASLWLDDCLRSVLTQNAGKLRVEISLFDDGSTDDSLEIIKKWETLFHNREMSVVIGGHSGPPRGVGYAKNKAVKQSRGKYLCFQDSDDVMKPDRLALQYQMCSENEEAIIGCQFERDPPNSTIRYTHWANHLTSIQLNIQIYTSHGPTIIMPTWFCSRKIIERVGGFDETGKGTPEDLIFFYKHLDLGGRICRVNKVLLTYRYHPQQATFSVDENTIWTLRLKHLEETMLSKWTNGFTIWNAGKQGRKLYRSLSPEFRKLVTCFCDVDVKKIQQGVYIYENGVERPKPKVPIVHFSKAQKPFVICIKLGMTKGEFEINLDSLHLEEGSDYVHFN